MGWSLKAGGILIIPRERSTALLTFFHDACKSYKRPMNYFAHAVRFLDRPYFLIGTALPDMLSVSDRGSRLRSKIVFPFAETATGDTAELAGGILQHLHDDGWFHNTLAFHSVTGELTRLFRSALPNDDDGHRPAFLGHIVTEMLLDSVLIARDPLALDRYYAALAEIDPDFVQATVNQLVRQPADRLAALIPLFRQERFLADYVDSPRLLFRLNQVLRRVKLQPLPGEVVEVLDAARVVVAQNADELLAGFQFSPSPSSPPPQRSKDTL